MIRVSSISQAVRDLADGQDHFAVEAGNLRALLAELDRRHPGLGDYVREHMSVAIDGVLHQDGLDVPLAPDAEVVLVPRITAG